MVNYDIKNMYNWPVGARILVIVLASILLFIVGYVVDITRYKAQVTSSIQQEENLKEQLQLMMDKQISIKSSIAELPSVKALLLNWQEKILTKNELPGMLNEILKTGQANHLKITAFDPANEIKDGIYFKTPVSIDMSGTYDQIATFISQLANMPKLVNIDAFSVNTNSETNAAPTNDFTSLNSNAQIKAKLDIEIYRK
jgi:type IV pilus assembly protein PilO